ncbi:MAG: discoidin domain-containing protein, partial [Candidatus Micrarchaeota archaeon]
MARTIVLFAVLNLIVFSTFANAADFLINTTIQCPNTPTSNSGNLALGRGQGNESLATDDNYSTFFIATSGTGRPTIDLGGLYLINYFNFSFQDGAGILFTFETSADNVSWMSYAETQQYGNGAVKYFYPHMARYVRFSTTPSGIPFNVSEFQIFQKVEFCTVYAPQITFDNSNNRYLLYFIKSLNISSSQSRTEHVSIILRTNGIDQDMITFPGIIPNPLSPVDSSYSPLESVIKSYPKVLNNMFYFLYSKGRNNVITGQGITSVLANYSIQTHNVSTLASFDVTEVGHYFRYGTNAISSNEAINGLKLYVASLYQGGGPNQIGTVFGNGTKVLNLNSSSGEYYFQQLLSAGALSSLSNFSGNSE